jgi:hypothetical protein
MGRRRSQPWLWPVSSRRQQEYRLFLRLVYELTRGAVSGATHMKQPVVAAPPEPARRLNLAITGHREGNPALAANRQSVERVLGEILDLIEAESESEAATAPSGSAPVRFHSMLSEGVDLMAAGQALGRGWELVSPLPFGLDLNVAINALPATAGDAQALLDGASAKDRDVQGRAEAIRAMAARARLFELAECDEMIARLFVASLLHPEERRQADTFAAEISRRVDMAARVMLEQSDILIAVWDGATRALVGGTGHCIQLALEAGLAVVWIDPAQPDSWRIAERPEGLVGHHTPDLNPAARAAALRGLVRSALSPHKPLKSSHQQPGQPSGFSNERWRPRSRRVLHLYRRIEALFGADTWRGRLKGLRQTYETPEAIGSSSAAGMLAHARALPGQDTDFVSAIDISTLRRFAWADGISAFLSDRYRGGMMLNFLLAPLSIVVGLAYLPFASSGDKWIFAGLELILLVSILALTITGQRRRWHARWFETRRVAEYLRHAPIMLLLGVVRPARRWPRGAATSWPEWYARRSLREAGLPRIRITQSYLRSALSELVRVHVRQQQTYHVGKARRLASAHHNLDRLSECLFALAVLSVSSYLILKAGGALHAWPKAYAEQTSYLFTFLGVALPTFGGSVAGIRYFGDFERFSSISEITSEKLALIDARLSLLLDTPDTPISYAQAADLIREVDNVVVGEIEAWQAVFAGKNVTIPV